MHLLITSIVFLGHILLVMTMFRFKLFMSVLGGQSLLVLNRLNSVLVVVNLIFPGHILVDLSLLRRTNGFVRRFRFDVGLDSGIVVFTWSKNLYISDGNSKSYIFDSHFG